VFIKGLIYGLIVSFANFAVSYINLSSLVKKRPASSAGKPAYNGSGTSSVIFYLLSFLIRFVIIGVLVYIFLKFKWGSILGLITGFTAALIIFTAWRLNSGNTGGDKL
jgi:hypothetical protein